MGEMQRRHATDFPKCSGDLRDFPFNELKVGEMLQFTQISPSKNGGMILSQPKTNKQFSDEPSHGAIDEFFHINAGNRPLVGHPAWLENPYVQCEIHLQIVQLSSQPSYFIAE